MKEKEIRNFLELAGYSEGRIEHYTKLEMEDKVWAWLPTVRFVRPLNNQLRKYLDGDFIRQLKEAKENNIHVDGIVGELLEAGVTPELISKFAYEITSTSYNEVLYRLVEPSGADYDLDNTGADLPSWRLVEVDENGKLTGRYIQELHNLIPY